MKSSAFGERTGTLDYQTTKYLQEKSWLILQEDMLPIMSDKRSLSKFVAYLCDPNCRPYRYVLAIFLSMIEGMLTFCADFPAGIQSTTIKVMKLDNTKYNMLFSAYTWPDIVMSILGTVMVGKYLGMRRGIIVFTGVVFAGQVTVSIGAYTNSFEVMLFGRILLGCGFGTALSLTSAFIILWFGGKEVTFVMSLARCFHRLSATLALFTPKYLYDSLDDYLVLSNVRHGTTQMLCTLMALCTVVCAIIVAFLDRRGAKIIGRKPIPKKKISILGILSFSSSFWILILICSVYYSVITALTANGPLYFVSKYGFSQNAANIANSFSYLAIIFTTPFVALLIDFTGYNLVWGLLGICFAIASNVIYIFSRDIDTFAPYLAAVVYSISFTFFGSAMLVAVGYLVPQTQLTTAYGTLMSLIAFSITIINVSAGIIIDHGGYFFVETFLLIMLFIIFLLDIFLSLLEIVTGNVVLNVPGMKRMK